ncbi:MAG: Ig-like domain-containing protein [Kiloniellales bacterium]|nr:Ig-like domain-containing protein [Kiloniellales bacterium]
MAVFFGSRGRDILKGTTGSDLIFAHRGDDHVEGGDGHDWLLGDRGRDTLLGGKGNDHLMGGRDDDFMDGGAGNDVFYFRGRYDAKDLAYGGDGVDKIVNIHCSNLTFENFDGRAQSIEIVDARWRDIDGNNRDNVLDFRGTTLVNFRLIDANGGDDLVHGSDSGETIQGDDGHDRLYGHGGDDKIDGGRGRDYIDGGAGDDELRGGRDVDVIHGGAGDDTILHNAREDWRDEVHGGEGYDSLVNVGWRNMKLENFGPDNSIERIDGRWRDVDGTNGDNVLDFSETELHRVRKIDAEDGDDRVTGSAGRETIEGDDGNDIIDAGAGSDKVYAGRDDDVVIHRASENQGSRDYYDGGRGTDTLRLVVSREQYESEAFQADLARYEDFLDDNSRPWSKWGRSFEFETMDLKVRNFERVEVVIEEEEPGENTPPVAEDDSFVAQEGNTMSGDLMVNDHDPDGHSLSVTEINGSAVTDGQEVTLGSGALLTIGADGTFGYATNGQFETLGAGQTFTETFTYTVSDGHGGSATATATITVNGVNDDPVAALDQATVAEDATVSLDVLGNASDVDSGDVVSLAGVDDSGTVGSVSIVGGQIVYDPNGQFETLGVGQTASDSFSYTVADDNGGSTTVTVAVTITGVNDDPNAVADTAMTDENSAVVIDVLANDSDVDANDSFGVTSASAANGSVQVNGDGTLTYTPNAGFVGNDTIDYTITDSNGGSSSATVSVTVNDVNEMPVSQDDSFGATESNTLLGNVLANDTDPDGDTLTVVSVNNNSNNVGQQITLNSGALLTLAANGDLSFVTNGAYEYLSEGDTATETFTYEVSDGRGGTATATGTITVAGENDDPVAAADAVAVSEDGTIAISVLANDTDVDANDTLSVDSVDATGVQGNVSIVNGQVVYDPNGQFESLGQGESVTETFSYTMSDNHGRSSTATVTVTVNGVNDAPNAAADSATTDEDSAVNIAVLGNDSDAEDGNNLTVTEVNGVAVSAGETVTLNSGAQVTLNADGTFSYQPNGQFESLGANQTDSDSFTYTVVDSEGVAATATVNVTLDGVNDAPVAADDASVTDQDTAVTINVLSNDLDAEGHALSVAAVGTAANGNVAINADGTVTYTPNAGFSGSDSFTYDVSDGNGGVHTATVSVTVNPVAPPPSGPTVFNVANLDGSNGFVIPADDQFDSTVTPTWPGGADMGSAISAAGDVNGDGIDDFLVSDPDAELSTFQPNFPDSGGVTYLVFGQAGGFPTSFDVRTEPSDGNAIQLFGAQIGGRAGTSVSGGGDIDGDGFADLIIGEPGSGAGRVFVVQGGANLSSPQLGQSFTPNVPLEFLNDANQSGGTDTEGFEIIGESNSDRLGTSVAHAGDFDGDGLADFIIGAPGDGTTDTGSAYVIFDSSAAWSGQLQLANLEANQGLKLVGFEAGSEFGYSVAGAGDVNGDGYADVIVGAKSADPNNQSTAGQAFVVFGSAAYAGSAGQAAQVLDVSTLDGSNGFALNGIAGDQAGISVAVVGDVDGDGYDDLLIGANLADTGGNENAGQAFLVYGGSGGFAPSLDLQALDGNNGFAINGIAAWDEAGYSVGRAGDVNGDGLDDIIIGAQAADPNGSFSGEAYLVYGQAGRSFSSFDLADLGDTGAGGANEGGQLGFVIEGSTSSDRIGTAVNGIGDVNGDGFDDIAVGGRNAGSGDKLFTGESYVIYGGNFTGDVSHAGTSGDDVLTGSAGDDNMLGGAGNDTLTGGAGNDRMVGGGGNDVYVFDSDDGADTLEDFELYDSTTQTGDRIDLSGVAGVQSFADLVIQDNAGDADILLGNGQSITLRGVNGSDLDADDFLF